MSMIKYRVHEVAKDFKINGKAVNSDINGLCYDS